MQIQIKDAPINLGKDQDVQQYLTFLIAGEEYAVNLLKVKEIIEYDTVTRVPNTPECVRGVMNLRGSVVPVIDLAVKFGQESSEIAKLTCIVIAEVEREGQASLMGIMADEVRQVIDLKSEEIEKSPIFGTRVRMDYLVGMVRAGRKFCLILDTDKVLFEKFRAHERVEFDIKTNLYSFKASRHAIDILFEVLDLYFSMTTTFVAKRPC